MDNLTHSLFALTLARTPLRPHGKAGATATAVLLIASNAPDVDIVAAFSASEGSYLAAHRGPTHGPLGILVLGVGCALIVAGLRRRPREGSEPPPGLMRLAALGVLGTLLHVLMDLPTPYGTRLFSPFSDRWYALDWMPIIDTYLWMLLAGGLLIGRGLRGQRGTIAAATLLLVASHYAIHAIGHAAAVERTGGTAPWRLEHWDGQTPDACDPAVTHPCASLAALPTFSEPFEWDVVRPIAGGYQMFELDLRSRSQPAALVAINTQDEWVDRVRASRLGRIFYQFARFPAATVTSPSDGVIVRVRDVRYAGPVDSADRRSPFVVIFELDRGGSIRRARLGR
jgi:membrane-bound metal-dependent hydrolase YbcI (DUF457 family)